MRACYLIQSHREPTQLLRLVATLKRQSPSCRVVIAHDTSRVTIDGSLFARCSDVELVTVAGPIERGRLSLLTPYFAALRHLRTRDLDYDWVVYLSAQDYPTQPLARSEAVLAEADCDGFLRLWSPLAPIRGKVRDRRYRYAYFDAPPWVGRFRRTARLFNRVQSLVHVHLVFDPRIGLRRPRLPLPPGWMVYRGYQWTTLRRRCAEYLLDALERERSVMEYFRRTICPDEALAQTLLANAGRFKLIDDDLRFHQTGHTRDGRARVLGVDDLPELLSGRYHFARKFDPAVDSKVLDLLDQALA